MKMIHTWGNYNSFLRNRFHHFQSLTRTNLLTSKMCCIRMKNDMIFRLLTVLCFLSLISYGIYIFSLVALMIQPVNRFNLLNMTMSYHHIIIDEKNINLSAAYFRHATTERNSSYPFISGDTFRSMADFVFDEIKRDDLKDVKSGDIVFLKGDTLHSFFGPPYQSISKPFVLITHNSDFYVPEGHFERLNDEKLIAWYGSNPGGKPHPKLIPIPIGLANRRWTAGNLTFLQNAFHNYRKPWSDRKILMYVNFSPQSNPIERSTALAQARRLNGSFIVQERITPDKFLRQVADAKFVLSPSGNGLDCHRTWEAMMLGAVPIVRSSGLDPLFSQIPVVIVQDWTNLTQSILDSYVYPANQRAVPLVLYARYWRQRIFKTASPYREKRDDFLL